MMCMVPVHCSWPKLLEQATVVLRCTACAAAGRASVSLGAQPRGWLAAIGWRRGASATPSA